VVLSSERPIGTRPVESGMRPVESQSPAVSQRSVAAGMVEMLRSLGVEYAFGVSGGAIAPIWAALENSEIDVLHFRHEAGAAFAATEAYFASDRPVVVFTTAGPGITNALTGLFAARWEGAKVIFVSPATSSPQRGRWACQETSGYAMPLSGLFASGSLFHYATKIESAAELPEVSRRLASGLSQPGGFVAHVSVPTDVQSSGMSAPLPKGKLSTAAICASNADIAHCAQLLAEGDFAIWVGFGARRAADSIRELAERTGAAVMCSPRGKGIFPEDHPQFIGVTGFGGHMSVLTYMREYLPKRILVLGTRLGEFTSFWNPLMVPEGGFIHVDLDPTVPGTAYPEAETLAVQSDAGEFLRELLKFFPAGDDSTVKSAQPSHISAFPQPERMIAHPCNSQERVRPDVLMDAIQALVVEGSNALVMAEPGNSFAWAINRLRFIQPNRFRTSTSFASMGHTVAGVVGGVAGRQHKVIAIVGDGSMLMNNEIATAVKYKLPAVWIVLNDSCYNMVDQVMSSLNVKNFVQIPRTNFVQIAQGMGAQGVCITQESEIQAALNQAVVAQTPFVVDVVIDPTCVAPIQSRMKSLIAQGAR